MLAPASRRGHRTRRAALAPPPVAAGGGVVAIGARDSRRHRAEGAQRRHRGAAQLVHHVVPEKLQTEGVLENISRVILVSPKMQSGPGIRRSRGNSAKTIVAVWAHRRGVGRICLGGANAAPRDPWARGGARHPRNPPSPPPTPRARAGGTDLHALVRPNTAARKRARHASGVVAPPRGRENCRPPHGAARWHQPSTSDRSPRSEEPHSRA